MTQSIGVGLAAYGMSGRVFHAPLLTAHPGFRLKSIVERHTETARERYPDLTRTESFDALLADDDIALVVVNTPDTTHYELAKRAIEAGRHVVVEKPFTGRVDLACKLIELAEQRGVLLTAFYNRRWDGDFQTVQQVLAQGSLGRVVECEMRWDRYRPAVAPQSWKEQATGGSGTLPNLGVHLLDQALQLFGWPEALTARLCAMREGAEVEDWIDVRLHYPRLEVTLKASYVAVHAGPRFVLHGTGGSFVKPGLDPQEQALAAGGRPDRPHWGEDEPWAWGTLWVPKGEWLIPDRKPTVPGRYLAFYDGLHAAISEQAPLPVMPTDALRVLQLLEAARRSHASGSTVVLEPVP